MQNDLQDKTDNLMHKVDKAIECYRLVADFFARSLVVDDCCQDVKIVNGSMASLGGVMANNTSFVTWINNLLQLFWIIYGGWDAVQGAYGASTTAMDLGTFLAVLSLFKSNGAMFESIFNVYLTIATTYPALWRIVELMNVPSDSKKREEMVDFRLAKTGEEFQKSKVANPGAPFPMDCVPLSSQNLCYSYDRLSEPHDHHGQGAKKTPVWQVRDFTQSFTQGLSVAITGPSGSGKTTLLKILGQILPPVEGTTFIPSHLRVLHVSAEVVLWPGSIAENVFFGACASHGIMTDQYQKLPEEILQRGFRICKRLHFSREMQAQVENLESHDDVESLALSTSQNKLIHIARALIVNPEVMIVHHPTLTLPKDMSKVIITALKAYVTERGIEMCQKTKHLRRPRTLFYSSQEAFAVKFADKEIRLVAPPKDE
jgi:ABC-type multidrug transport system fused ATPase/permease subunit